MAPFELQEDTTDVPRVQVAVEAARRCDRRMRSVRHRSIRVAEEIIRIADGHVRVGRQVANHLAAKVFVSHLVALDLLSLPLDRVVARLLQDQLHGSVRNRGRRGRRGHQKIDRDRKLSQGKF